MIRIHDTKRRRMTARSRASRENYGSFLDLPRASPGYTAEVGLIMLAGCLIPIAVLAAVFVFNINLGTFGFYALMLLCPLLHIFMMRGMGHNHDSGKGSCQESPSQTGSTEVQPAKRS